MACLRSLSRRSLYPNLLCYMTSRPVVLHHHIKDFTEPTFPDSSLLIRSFHRHVFFEDTRKMSFVQLVGFSGVSLCRQMSSKPEELCSKIDAFGNVVEESVEAIVTNVATIDECTAITESVFSPEGFVQYVINGIHELTGFNWWMSIVLTAFLVTVLMSPVSMRVQNLALELQIRRRLLALLCSTCS
ncbi:OxaA/YidC-like membrane insertion protein [Arabidopsis thaliana]|uniref:OxaA/YidC-like membrane insertion protein n=1 Tax=Arabidopsis thaliana TaxID=3702 RepID=F4II94_ARATH|nr:OxaA/YidC-like membrane insertion protein [Arabidopsis thaliana]AEC10700.1 OxaA/YidC-like membrane insertion protein [Arabidopsis thaliana]|eukprot:NP_850455.4 OxaA/YidC-like membrane insertion protein [Arabidopsis thaliana]